MAEKFSSHVVSPSNVQLAQYEMRQILMTYLVYIIESLLPHSLCLKCYGWLQHGELLGT